jgi:hypothetical protein
VKENRERLVRKENFLLLGMNFCLSVSRRWTKINFGGFSLVSFSCRFLDGMPGTFFYYSIEVGRECVITCDFGRRRRKKFSIRGHDEKKKNSSGEIVSVE